jgi:hypothetical protein
MRSTNNVAEMEGFGFIALMIIPPVPSLYTLLLRGVITLERSVVTG